MRAKKFFNDSRIKLIFVVAVLFASLFQSCNFISEIPEEISAPIVQTNSADMISRSGVKVNATILDNGGSPLIEFGVCWTEDGVLRTKKSSRDILSNKVDTFSVEISDLKPKTDYYFRAYAVNSLGTSYGDSLRYNFFFVTFKVPVIKIQPAENVGVSSATLVAVLMPNNKDTKSSFEVFDPYEFESQTINLPETFSGSDSIRVEFNLTGLQSGREYSFALRANNADGETVSSASKFITLKP